MFLHFQSKAPVGGTFCIHGLHNYNDFPILCAVSQESLQSPFTKNAFSPWNIHLSNSATYPRLIINYLDNCFNSLLRFANVDLAFAYRFIASFMVFGGTKITEGLIVLLRFTAEALEINTCPHISQLESFSWVWLLAAIISSLMEVGGEGRKISNITDKSYRVMLSILSLLDTAF